MSQNVIKPCCGRNLFKVYWFVRAVSIVYCFTKSWHYVIKMFVKYNCFQNVFFLTYFRCLGGLPSSALPTFAFLQFRLNGAKERMTRQVYTVFGWFLTISVWYLSCHGLTTILTMYLSEIANTEGIFVGSKGIVLKNCAQNLFSSLIGNWFEIFIMQSKVVFLNL